MKKILYMAICTLAVCGCSKSETEVQNPNEMRFAAQYPAATRATATTFEANDAMGIYVTQYDGETPLPLQLSGNYGNNAKYLFNGTAWTSLQPIYWGDGKFDVFAYYPYMTPTSVDEHAFSVALDQSSSETASALSGYEASDFLWCKVVGVAKQNSVPLVFKHRMSKIQIRLAKGADYAGELPTDAVVRIHNTVVKATIDLATGIATKHPYESPQSITALKVSAGLYEAIVVPQRIETKRPLIEVVAEGVSYLVESSFIFKAGTQHNLTLTINSNPDQVKIEIGGEMEGGWE